MVYSSPTGASVDIVSFGLRPAESAVVIWYCLLPILMICCSGAYAQVGATFSMPNSVLLFAHPYRDLEVVAPEKTLVLKPPIKNNVLFGSPSIATTGASVSWGFFVSSEGGPPGAPHGHYVLGIYSIAEQQWKSYGDFTEIGATAFSFDSSKVAFVAEEHDHVQDLFVFDVAAEKMTKVPHSPAIAPTATLGWSPDGNSLVAELQRNEKNSSIAVINLNTGKVQIVADGNDPAWSPSGEWIAYYDPSGKKCMLVHPDGTNTRVAKDFGRTVFGDRAFSYAVVWSPDSKSLLLNEVKGEEVADDVQLLNLQSGAMIRKSKNGAPVFGWAYQHK